MKTRKIYIGLLNTNDISGEDHYSLCLNGYPEKGDYDWLDEPILADVLAQDITNYGNNLSVRYFISDSELDEDQLNLELMKTIYGNDIDSDNVRFGVRYSEYTGYLWTDEDIMIGGHDLLEELKSHIGKYLWMEITYSK
jgi:hypothetical protein